MAIEPFCQLLFQPALLHMASSRMLKITTHEDLVQLEKDMRLFARRISRGKRIATCRSWRSGRMFSGEFLFAFLPDVVMVNDYVFTITVPR